MALEADCGSSTALDAPRVASKAGFIVPGECRASAALTVSCRVFRDESVTLLTAFGCREAPSPARGSWPPPSDEA